MTFSDRFVSQPSILDRLASAYPPLASAVEHHREEFGEDLPHVFFGSDFLPELRRTCESGEMAPATALLQFVESLTASADAQAEGVLMATILPGIADLLRLPCWENLDVNLGPNTAMRLKDVSYLIRPEPSRGKPWRGLLRRISRRG